MRRFAHHERAVLLNARSFGPKMLGYVEAIGIRSLRDLAERDAESLAFEINLHLGKPHINRFGVAALDAAVAAARHAIAPSSGLPALWRSLIDPMLAKGERVILGLAGTPGAGKSSAAAAIAAAYHDCAVVVPMDGFHLANAELARLGLENRKGAPETFDAAGYTALLARIRRAGPDETVYAPAFLRAIEEPIAGAIAVSRACRLVITEGNYLLLDGAWAGVRPLLDACWYLDITAEARIERLVARHRQFGRSRKDATEWVLRSDEANARQIETSRARADRIVAWPPA